MTDTTGLVIQGDERKNTLTVQVVKQDNGDRDVYNVIDAAGGDDVLSGTSHAFPRLMAQTGVQLFGEEGNDRISDSQGNDTLSGGDGDDSISSRWGHDVIDGGDGTDTLVYAGLRGPLTNDRFTLDSVEQLALGNFVVIKDFNLYQFGTITSILGSTLRFIEQANIANLNFEGAYNWRILGSKFGDTFDFSSSPDGFTIQGKDGDDIIIGGQSHSDLNGGAGTDTLLGGARSDSITGGSGDDSINAGGGSDYITEHAGNNTIHGGDGNDDLEIYRGSDVVYGDAGNDRIDLYGGTQTVYAGGGDDIIAVSNANPKDDVKWVIHGGAGHDELYPPDHISQLYCDGVEELNLAGSSHTVLIREDTLDGFHVIDGLLGHKIVFSDGGNFTWRAGFGKGAVSPTELVGSEETDQIDVSKSDSYWAVDGRDGDDVLLGGKQYNGNTLYGGAGDDIIDGGIGGGHVHGGAGRDTFRLSSGDGFTVVWDFHTGGTDHDVIDVSDFKSVTNFADFMRDHVEQIPDGVEIFFGDQETDLVLEHVSYSKLNASDFHF